MAASKFRSRENEASHHLNEQQYKQECYTNAG